MMPTTNDSMAHLEGVSMAYGKQLALDRVDIEIRRGQLLSLLGPNGAGKSTAISLLLGLLQPDKGRVRLFGDNPQSLRARRRIGVMLQSAQLPDSLRVGELLRVTASYYPHPLGIEQCAERAAVGDLLRRPYGKLSGGQQRRVQFALALCGRPELLFLDEPTVGMDIEARQKMWQAMRDLVADGCSILLTTHYLEEAEALSQRVVVLGQGRVLGDGSVDAMRALVASSSIRCRTTLEVENMRRWPNVQQVSREGDYTVLISDQAEDVLRRLLQADAQVADLEVRRAGLAEAMAQMAHPQETAVTKEAA